MSGPGDHGRGCDRELIFELADRTLEPEREREVRTHLARCPGCRGTYQRDVDLNAYLSCMALSEAPMHSVCRGVAMALPTRTVKARIFWAVLALGLILSSFLALFLNGVNPITAAASILRIFWSLIFGLSEAAQTFLSLAGPVILVALAVGAAVDLLIAVAVLAVARRRSREA